MNSTGHMIAGVLSAAAALILIGIFSDLSVQQGIWFAAIVFFYSQLPDTDHQNSKITHLINDSLVFVTFGLLIGAYVWGIPVLYGLISTGAMVIFVLIKKTPHRGFMHTLTANIIFATPLLWFGVLPALLGFVAYWSHLWMDIKTHDKEGNPKIVFYPFRLWGAVIR